VYAQTLHDLQREIWQTDCLSQSVLQHDIGISQKPRRRARRLTYRGIEDCVRVW
jgi:hypothetical protein